MEFEVSLEDLAKAVKGLPQPDPKHVLYLFLTRDDWQSLRNEAQTSKIDTGFTSFAGIPILLPQRLQVSVFLHADGTTTPLKRNSNETS